MPRSLTHFLHTRNEISRYRASEYLIYEFEIASARKRLHSNFAIAVLAVAPALFFMLSLHVGSSFDRFAIRNLRRMQQDFNAIALLQTGHGYFHMHLALA